MKPNPSPAQDESERTYSIKELVDIDKLRALFEEFSMATGFTTGLVSYPGQELLITTGWRDICVKFHRVCPAASLCCKKSNIQLTSCLRRQKKLNIQPCGNGLVDGATPVIVRGKHVASLATGQVFVAPPDLKFHRELARRYGYDEETYMEALSKVPVVSERRLKGVLKFLSGIAAQIAEESLNKLIIQESMQALDDSRKMLSQVLDSVPLSVFWKNRDSVYLGCNKVFLRYTGLTSQAEIVGKTDSDLPWSASDSASYIADDREVIETNRPKCHIIETLHRKDGARIWLDSTKVPLKDSAGNTSGILGVFEDITERKETEEINRRLMVAIDQASESILFTDLDGSILYVNQGFEKSTGYTRQEVLGKNPRILKSGKQPDSYYRQMWKTLQRGEGWHGRFVNRRKDGQLFEEDVTISPVRNTQNRIVSYVAVKRDITREIMLEQQVVESQKMEAVGLLAGGLAHDYNNILAANMLQLGMILERTDLPPEVSDALQLLHAGEKRAAALSRQLLMFSRRQAMKMEVIDLVSIVGEMLRLLDRLIGEQCTLVFPAAAEPAWVKADASMVEQVILNLCINARDAMPKGGRISVSIRSLKVGAKKCAKDPQARPGSFICLSLADEGCGMDEETKKRIFEPFFTTKEVGKGTGLGLATVYGIVKQHEGWIEVSSVIGKGSEFRIYLPSIGSAVGETAVSQKNTVSSGTETILLVEDNAHVVHSLKRYLTAKGYRVFTCGTGVAALRQWSKKLREIDLLITDMIMPGGVSGSDLVSVFHKERPGLPVIILSGYSEEIAGIDVPKQTAVSYLSKPCDVQVLTSTIRKALEKRKARA